LKISHWI